MTRVKICGIKSAGEGLTALRLGADMLGFIFYRPVARWIEPDLAAEIIAACRGEFPDWKAVGVFVDEPLESINQICHVCGFDVVQLAGSETPTYAAELVRPAIKVLRTREQAWSAELLAESCAGYAVERFLVDSHLDGFYGGTGTAADWQGLAGIMDRHILAGGLRPDNVASALELARPWGVDVSSGVERDGRKDPSLVGRFIEAVRAFDGRWEKNPPLTSPAAAGEGQTAAAGEGLRR